MTDFKATKTQATLIAIAGACGRFTKIGNFVSEVSNFNSHGNSGRAFLRGRLDSGWEFEVVAPICPFSYDHPCLDQEIPVHFSQRLIREGDWDADWTGIDLRVRYSLLDGITVTAAAATTNKICPSTCDLVEYSKKIEANEPGDATIKLHIQTCNDCALYVEILPIAIRKEKDRRPRLEF